KSKGKLREYEASQISAKFNGINNMQLAKNIGTFNESSIPSSAISSKINNNRSKIFLATCINEFVKKIFGYPPYSKEETEIQTKTKNMLSDFWHKFNQLVLGHVKNYKEIQERCAALLTKENINDYINEKVTIDILNRFIGGTNQRELQKCSAVKKLVQLIREMFKIHWQGKNIDQ
ncbi:26248_t:CDS:2, partial [Dentiscutata erythropus]